MKIETKYEIGQHIWYVCKNKYDREIYADGYKDCVIFIQDWLS